jgi:hypothetical protein
MPLILERLLQSCTCLAHSVYWRTDHCSFRAVDGAQMSSRDYRAAGCMRLVRAATPGFAAGQQAKSPVVRSLVVCHRGIAPPLAMLHAEHTRFEHVRETL